MRLIGIHGKKRSGKDTVAGMLVKHYPRMQLIAFADMLKDVCALVTSTHLSYFREGWPKETPLPKGGMSPRQIMTGMHDALVPVFGEMIFVDAVKMVWEEMKHREAGALERGLDSLPTGLIVTDVRYEREANWVRSEGGLILHIFRPETDGQAGTHSSELGIKGDYEADFDIENSGTLEDLAVRVNLFADWYGRNPRSIIDKKP